MQKITVGLLAHVDAGKTTLSEGLLYLGGALRTHGRVDHRDTFLDTDAIERERGITVFSKQAVLPCGDMEFTFLDTPGHMDFSGEMERTLRVLDYAIMLISATDGVQAHTRTILRLLARYQIPTFVFFNKCDLPNAGKDALTAQLQPLLDGHCVDFSDPDGMLEQAAMCDELLLEQYDAEGTITQEALRDAISARRLFPCFFGAALKLEGVQALLDGMCRYMQMPVCYADFSARVFKVAHDEKENRLTFLKVTGGCLHVKDTLNAQDGSWSEKVHEIRIYSGAKYTLADRAETGTVCAVTGLTQAAAGACLGAEPEAEETKLQPAVQYQVILEDGTDAHTALKKLRILEAEDPLLHLVWNAQLGEIFLSFMGQIQMEILQRQIKDRLGLSVSFGEGSVVYKETVAAPVIGIGHYEPLRHYAEVHLLIEPGARGSGLQFFSACSTDELELNWQRLILTHLMEKEHLGVLTGSPVTDLRITLLAGRAHLKHTEGGDFRQATYRAVRQGLRSAKSILLEPYYAYQITVPTELSGRVLRDLERMRAKQDAPVLSDSQATLTGLAPVRLMRSYPMELASFTHGAGSIGFHVEGYYPCEEQEKLVQEIGYNCDADLENTADSVFCSHGAGHVVSWQDVPQMAHLKTVLDRPQEDDAPQKVVRKSVDTGGSAAESKELQAIFERTYGAIRRSDFLPRRAQEITSTDKMLQKLPKLETFLLVDGYNMIFAWDELKKLAQDDLELARQTLIRILCNYQGFRKCNLILVFDAYKVTDGQEKIEKQNGIYVVYTRHAQLADNYIERVTNQLGKRYQIRVATSDGLEQIITLAHGALRVSAQSFREEVLQTDREIAEILARLGK